VEAGSCSCIEIQWCHYIIYVPAIITLYLSFISRDDEDVGADHKVNSRHNFPR